MPIKIDKKTIAINIGAGIVVILTITVPVLFAIHLAKKQGIEIEQAKVLSYAQDVLRRTDDTADQIASGIQKLKVSGSSNPCSEANISIMREIDLNSSYIQAIGHMSGNVMDCSSLGKNLKDVDLGPVELVSKRSALIRTNVTLPITKNKQFIVVERDHYAAIIHKNLPIDASTPENGASLATFSAGSNKILTSRGFINPAWLDRLGNNESAIFLDDGYLVAALKSKKHLTGAIAAIPSSFLDSRIYEFKKYMIPVGIISGIVLAFAVLQLARQQLGIPTAIKVGLRKNEFFVEYQPVVNLKTGEWIGAEALLRWRRSDGTLIRPDLFIPIAEEAGLIGLITERVICLISEDLHDIFKKHPDFHVAINLSASDLQSPHIAGRLNQLISDAGAGPNNFIVEATERGFMNPDLSGNIIRKIRENGIRVAVDDFGTGYSSLSYLESFELDFLKIDKSFVNTLGTDAPTSKVITHIIDMANSLKMEMIAEGVETEAQAEFLRNHGVQFAQGWLFSKPISIVELERAIIKAC